MMSKYINISTPICNTSYGYVGQNLVKWLQRADYQVSLRVIGDCEPDVGCQYDKDIQKCSPTFFPKHAHIIVWHASDLKKFIIKGNYNIGFPIFELDSFTKEEVVNLNAMSAIFTPSKWAAGVLKNYVRQDMPVHVIPLGVDPEIFVNPGLEREKIGEIKTVNAYQPVKFLHIGKWEVRKNQVAILKAFANVFRDTREATLTLVCNNPFIGDDNQKWEQLAKKLLPDFGKEDFHFSPLTIFPSKFESQTDIVKLMLTHDVGLFPSLAEGWNLELLELLHLQKRCIATDYSAHTEFINQFPLCKKIPIVNITPAYDFKWFFGQGSWSEWGVVEQGLLEGAMYQTYLDVKKDRENLTTNTSSTIIKEDNQFTWANSVRKIEAALTS